MIHEVDREEVCKVVHEVDRGEVCEVIRGRFVRWSVGRFVR